ncbi:MAG TPA: three-Cys-motif partner protein TcmP [Terriglobales bacterium]|nr:three-Cys-motif partner protein TcmP [Terriglobales bacterium]
MDGEYSIENDGLTIPEVGAWAEDKHRLVSLYSTLFSSGMKNKWSKRVYIELYAGAGYSRIRGTSKLILGSPLHALQLKDRFDKYVFCDESRENLDALKTRAERIAPGVEIAYVRGNCNHSVDEVLAAIPKGSTQSTVLSLCFADPFDISLEFATIRALANARFIDFLVLLALGMDANRNYEYYLREDSDKIDKFLGSNDWRTKWKAAQWDAVKFTRFLADEFTKSMATLEYIPPPYYKMKEVRSYEKNLALYRLALFSRNERAYNYWDEVLKYSTDQKAFWD